VAITDGVTLTIGPSRSGGGLLAVLDRAGNVIAHEGDRVEIGGQDVGGGTWLGCGGMSILR
jgi:hypothetical protein